MTARSVAGSRPTISASAVCRRRTSRSASPPSAAAATTWLLVRIWPSALMTMPEPLPRAAGLERDRHHAGEHPAAACDSGSSAVSSSPATGGSSRLVATGVGAVVVVDGEREEGAAGRRGQHEAGSGEHRHGPPAPPRGEGGPASRGRPVRGAGPGRGEWGPAGPAAGRNGGGDVGAGAAGAGAGPGPADGGGVARGRRRRRRAGVRVGSAVAWGGAASWGRGRAGTRRSAWSRRSWPLRCPRPCRRRLDATWEFPGCPTRAGGPPCPALAQASSSPFSGSGVRGQVSSVRGGTV